MPRLPLAALVRPLVVRRLARPFASHADRPPSTSTNPAQDTDANDPLAELKAAYALLPTPPPRLDTPPPPQLPSVHFTDPLQPPLKPRWSLGRSPVFLPNIFIYPVPPAPSDASDPYTAIFRAPLQLSKIDIYNYLRQIYGLGITSIRTAIYRAPYRRTSKRLAIRPARPIARRDPKRTYKKVWVGLDKPFFYPPPRSVEWLNKEYGLEDIVNAHDWGKWRTEGPEAAEEWKRLATAPRGRTDRGAVRREDVLGAVAEARWKRGALLDRYVERQLAGDGPVAEGNEREEEELEKADREWEVKWEKREHERRATRSKGRQSPGKQALTALEYQSPSQTS